MSWAYAGSIEDNNVRAKTHAQLKPEWAPPPPTLKIDKIKKINNFSFPPLYSSFGYTPQNGF